MNIFSSRNRVQLIGNFFILQLFLSVLQIVTDANFIRGDIPTSSLVNLTIPADYEAEACQKENNGEGILIDIILFKYHQYPDCYREIKSKTPRDIALRQTLQRSCNGKNRCFLPDGIWLDVNLTCGVDLHLTNRIEINIKCIPIVPDSQHVFRMTPHLSAKVNKSDYNISYLVLEVQQAVSPTELSCEIEGNNEEEIKFTLLHVDFGPNAKCDGGDLCHGYINITYARIRTISFTYDWLPNETFSEHLKTVRFDVSISTGLVWIQIEEYEEIKIECHEMLQIISTTQDPEVEATNVGRESKENTTTNVANGTTIKVPGTTMETDDSVRAMSAPLEIVIPVCVAGLLALFAVALCVACVCSRNYPFVRWKRRKQRQIKKESRYPLQDEYDYVTTNNVLDCTPKTGIAVLNNTYPGKDKKYRESDYMEISPQTTSPTSPVASPTYSVTTPLSTAPLLRRSGAPLTPVRPNKSPTTPSVSAPSRLLKVSEATGKPDESLYYMIDDGRAPLEEISVFYSSNVTSVTEIRKSRLSGEETEYSHLNQSTNQRNFENVYDG